MSLPGDDRGSLEQVLSRLRRPSLADNDVTIECLEAGRELLAQALDHDPRSAELHPFLQFLSRGEVRRAVSARNLRRVSDGQLRDRWASPTDYVRDLIAYLRFQRGDRSFASRSETWIDEMLTQVPTPSLAVRFVATANQDQLFANPLFRLQLLAAAVLGAADNGGEAPDLYSEIEDRWRPFLEAFLRRHSLQLRPGIDVPALLAALIAVGEGLALRELVDPTDGDRRNHRRSIQGTVTLALIAACTSPETDPHGLETLVDGLMNSRASAGDAKQSDDAR